MTSPCGKGVGESNITLNFSASVVKAWGFAIACHRLCDLDDNCLTYVFKGTG